MYEKNDEKYFVVDSHMHYWDASPQNWVAGAEQYAGRLDDGAGAPAAQDSAVGVDEGVGARV